MNQWRVGDVVMGRAPLARWWRDAMSVHPVIVVQLSPARAGQRCPQVERFTPACSDRGPTSFVAVMPDFPRLLMLWSEIGLVEEALLPRSGRTLWCSPSLRSRAGRAGPAPAHALGQRAKHGGGVNRERDGHQQRAGHTV